MAKTGDSQNLGTAEGALMGRAAHALHADSPILDDTWALRLLAPGIRKLVEDSAFATRKMDWQGFDPTPLFAHNVGALRYAEDEMERSSRDGIDQYVILGAGFDTFALRRDDLCARVRVYEVDHPDVQALKRERIARADASPTSMPTFIAVDFESRSLSEGLRESPFDPKRRCVVSWMNTLPYLSLSATEGTLRELAALCAAGSRLVLNYACDVPLSEEQNAYFESLREKVGQSGEPLQSRWKPEAFSSLLDEAGFAVLEHLTERDLEARYFAGRADGLRPSMPGRLVTAERRP
jgi:methyltransferase (TIGR00027 family)